MSWLQLYGFDKISSYFPKSCLAIIKLFAHRPATPPVGISRFYILFCKATWLVLRICQCLVQTITNRICIKMVNTILQNNMLLHNITIHFALERIPEVFLLFKITNAHFL